MRRPIATLACVSALLCATLDAGAQVSKVTIPRVAEPPILERYLDGTVTPPGVALTEFLQHEPGDGVPSSQPTAAYLSYDDQHLYVVFVCTDEPAKVRAHMSKRESISGDDWVGVIIDPYHDGHRTYILLTNPLGIQLDGIGTEGQEDDYSYDTLWRSEGRLTATGYVVVFSIPFKSLRFERLPEQTWGLAVGRQIVRNNETSFWPYITKRIASFGQQLATLEGISGVSPGRNLLAIPYATFTSAQLLNPLDGSRLTDNTGRAGIDAKAVIKDALTIDATVKPDFSQVESDEPQVTINQRFEVYFPEKRPFFLENADFFTTPQQVFFSRRIADPGVGLRATGRSHRWILGGLMATDAQPGSRVPVEDPRYDKTAGVGAIRVQRELPRQSFIGGIFTDREIGPEGNRVFGIDGRWRFNDNWVTYGQWAGSQTEDVDGSKTSGSVAYARVVRQGRSFNYETGYVQRSPDFRAELGYIPRVDYRELANEAGYTWHPKDSRILSFGPDLEGGALWNYAGDLEEWNIEPGFEMTFPGQTEVGVRLWDQFERFEGQDFRKRSQMINASSAWTPSLSLRGEYRWGTKVNYYPPAPLAPFLADGQDAEAGLTYRPFAQLRLEESYLFSRLSTRGEILTPAGPARGDIFNNHILRTKVNYQFTRALSLRGIVDYDAILPNESLVDLDREKRLGLDLLVTCMVNPWTAVYVGYTDVYENWALVSPSERPIVRGGGPTVSVGRQLFVKVSYLFRY